MAFRADPSGFPGDLTSGELDELQALGQRRRYPRGSTLFREADPSDWVVLLMEGRVKVSVVSAAGSEILLAIREPGTLLGELSALDGEPRSATVTALDPVVAVVVSAQDFRAFLASNPQAALQIGRAHV